MRDLFHYKNCGTFLRDSFLEAKKAVPGMTAEKYAQKLNLGASTFKMIITGRRTLSLKNINRVSSALDLSKGEHEYLEVLSLTEKFRGAPEEAVYRKKTAFLKSEAKTNKISLTSRDLLVDSLTLPILVYVSDVLQMSQVSPDDASIIGQIAKAFGTSPTRVIACLKTLKVNQPNSPLDPNQENHYFFSKLGPVTSRKSYLKKWLVDSSVQIENNFSNSACLFDSTTLSLSRDDAMKLNEEIKDLVDKYVSKAAQSNDKILVQANFQIYPLTK